MAHPDLDQLLNAVLPFAEQMLKKHGEFYPFGASMNHTGEVAMSAADTGSEHPPSAEVVALLFDGFKKQAAEKLVRACAVCFDSRVVLPGTSKKSDAVAVSLEHEVGEAVEIFIPYQKGFFVSAPSLL